MWVVLLAASIIIALQTWFELEGVEMSSAGINALIAGVVLSFLLGSGLMALVYHSARIGHDEKADDLTNLKSKKTGELKNNNSKPRDEEKDDLLIKILNKIFFWEKR
jgi:hypothetical protein